MSQGIDEDIDTQEALSEIIATLNNSAAEQSGTVQSEDEYRKQEFDVLTNTVGKPEDELHCINCPTCLYKGLPYIHSISLVHKLRETRVFKDLDGSFRTLNKEFVFATR